LPEGGAEEGKLDRPNPADDLLVREIVRFNQVIMGLVVGLLGAFFLFLATNWLVLLGGSRVGPHLNLLGQFFPGYSVSFIGSLIGAVYAFVIGFGTGWMTSRLYNFFVALRNR
jgi:hypothetical protein